MNRICRVFVPAAVLFVLTIVSAKTLACCPAPPSGKAVVNADQTVIIVWDAATKTEHVIRRASFKSEADDFGFIIPTPSQPVLDESGNEAFGFLAKSNRPGNHQYAGPQPPHGVQLQRAPQGAPLPSR